MLGLGSSNSMNSPNGPNGLHESSQAQVLKISGHAQTIAPRPGCGGLRARRPAENSGFYGSIPGTVRHSPLVMR